MISRLSSIAAAALMSLTAVPSIAQDRQPWLCLPGELNQVPLGAAVFDQTGQNVGWVSIDQCSEVARGWLHVRLDPQLGSALKRLPLTGVKPVDGGVMVPMTREQIAAAPTIKFP